MTELALFDFEGSDVRSITDQDGSPWFVGRDVCNALQHKNASQALSRLDDDERDGVHIMDPMGRPQNVVIVSESGLYSLVLSSRVPEAKRFKKWITSEVIPQIRKTGRYGAPEAALPNFTDPAEAAMAWAQEYKAKQALAAKAEEDAPKVEFHDAVAKLDGTMSVAEAAQSLGTGRNTLFRFLKREGWVIAHERNRPYQHVIKAGLMDLKLAEITRPNGTIKEVITPLITAKGFIKLQKDWKVAA